MSISTEIPEVVVKTGNMLPFWSPKIKMLALVIALTAYVYFLLFIKTIYMKSQRLDRISVMAAETEKLMRDVHNLDQKLAVRMEQLNSFYEDY